MTKKIAVFDIDGTLTNTHLGVEFLKEMAELDAIQGVSKELFTQQYTEWSIQTDRTAFYDEYFDDYYTSRLIGVDRKVFEEAGKKVADHAYPHLYTNVLERLKRHQTEGRFILIISKSPEQAVHHIAHLVKASDYWGWQFNFDANDKYIDQCTYPNGESDKAYIIQQKLSQHHLTLDDSFAYGDSNGDISMLELVTHANAINPEPKLLSIAKQNGWNVIETSR